MESGEKSLGKLLASLAPELLRDEYVFCTLSDGQCREATALPALATFWEQEGLSLVLERSQALEHGFADGAVMRGIRLGVHSSLEAVGLTAAVSGRLAERGISANVIAAYHHDYVFVPADRAEEALAALGELYSL